MLIEKKKVTYVKVMKKNIKYEMMIWMNDYSKITQIISTFLFDEIIIILLSQ